jgi:type IV pilus assembly protein PilA
MTALRMRQLAPEIAGAFAQSSGESEPAVMCAYADDSSIRGESTGAAMDAGTVAVVAAIAIPNLLRSRIAANEASAIGTLRTVNTAQVTYEATYPQRGFAPDLATLGSDPTTPTDYSEKHAGLVSDTLGCSTQWCERSGFRFRVISTCVQRRCTEFVAVGTPLSAGTGSRSFCTTSDGIIRVKSGPPLKEPPDVSECQSWEALR